jgi:RNA:NAD 2'-phosphotransferase (TPT1/KptA family)
MELSKQQQKYVSAVLEHAPAIGIDLNKNTFSRAELRQVSMAFKGKKWIPNWITHDLSRRADRGVFTIPEIMEQWNALQAVSPGHGTDGDELSDSTDVYEVVSDDMGDHTVSDDMLEMSTQN